MTTVQGWAHSHDDDTQHVSYGHIDDACKDMAMQRPYWTELELWNQEDWASEKEVEATYHIFHNEDSDGAVTLVTRDGTEEFRSYAEVQTDILVAETGENWMDPSEIIDTLAGDVTEAMAEKIARNHGYDVIAGRTNHMDADDAEHALGATPGHAGILVAVKPTS